MAQARSRFLVESNGIAIKEQINTRIVMLLRKTNILDATIKNLRTLGLDAPINQPNIRDGLKSNLIESFKNVENSYNILR